MVALAVGQRMVGVSVGLGGRRRLLARRRYVRLVEEVEEEYEVREVHEKRHGDVLIADLALFAVALLEVGNEIDVDAENHLRYLAARDRNVHPLGYAEAERSKAVVRVHGGVHREVHDDEPASAGAQLHGREPAVDEHRGVMIPVEKDELLFAQHDEQRVDELGHFAQHEQPRPAAEHAVCVLIVAYGMLDTLVDESVHELGPDAHGAEQAEAGEHEVPRDQRLAQVEALARLHVVLTGEYGDDVDDGVDDAQIPVVPHPVLLHLDVLVVEELPLVEEQIRIVEAGARTIRAIGQLPLARSIIFDVHFVPLLLFFFALTASWLV